MAAAAIEENIGHGNTVEVGGTQIERAGRIRIAVRIRDIIVRDRDHAIVASAPKAEVRLSGTALFDGTPSARRASIWSGAELAVRITPDGYVTVSTGDTAKPRPLASLQKKRERAIAPTFRVKYPGRQSPERQSAGRHRRHLTPSSAHAPIPATCSQTAPR